MRGVLREKVKKKTTAAQSIAKVLLATNMSSKSHKGAGAFHSASQSKGG